ncbi:MAG: hypothetical protein Q9227_008511 [Pyrenula ochraceoflavens]
MRGATSHAQYSSDPASAKYGRHWTADEVKKAFAPSQVTIEATTKWLTDAGINKDRIRPSVRGGFLYFESTLAELEALLQTEYFVYYHAETGQSSVACDQYKIPRHLKGSIDFISPGVSLSTPHRRHIASKKLRRRSDACPPAPGIGNSSLENCWLEAGSSCVNALYNIPERTNNHDMNTFGIFSLAGSYVQSDMDVFFEQVATEIPVGTVPEQKFINGATLSSNFTALEVEPNLDFQVAWPLVYPQNLTLFESSPTADQSIDPAHLSTFIVDGMDDMLAAMDGINPDQSISSPEVAVLQPQFNFSSSGGFSNYHPLPMYQREAIAQYFYQYPPSYPSYTYNGSFGSIGADGGRFSRYGRGFPDVSALGANFTTVNDGCISNTGGGTSAATPIFAAVVWKINAERLAAGKSTLGFINPTLYANPQVLNDVVSGNNPGCNSDGFEATPG